MERPLTPTSVTSTHSATANDASPTARACQTATATAAASAQNQLRSVMDELASSNAIHQAAAHAERVYSAVQASTTSTSQTPRQTRIPSAPTTSAPETVFLLDWDDTCLCTSYLESRGAMLDLTSPPHADLLPALSTLDQRVISLLSTALTLGRVLIVTNAGDGWVELSSQRFLPGTHAFLNAHVHDITVISARARYGNTFPHHALEWKSHTFADELRWLLPTPASTLNEYQTSVVVLGDSVGDQYAAHASIHYLDQQQSADAQCGILSDASSRNNIFASNTNSNPANGTPTRFNKADNVLLKVVKFLEHPSPQQLAHELLVLVQHLPQMANHHAAFDVSMNADHHPNNHIHEDEQQHHQEQHVSQPQPSTPMEVAC